MPYVMEWQMAGSEPVASRAMTSGSSSKREAPVNKASKAGSEKFAAFKLLLLLSPRKRKFCASAKSANQPERATSYGALL